jgi:hypothetical protein
MGHGSRMMEDPKHARFRRILGWLILPVIWLGLIGSKFLSWRNGDVSLESFVTTSGMGAMVVFFGVAMPFIDEWRVSRSKSPPVYRSTILD